MKNDTYGCHSKSRPDTAPMCRYDQRDTDRKCVGCSVPTDTEFLRRMGLLRETPQTGVKP